MESFYVSPDRVTDNELFIEGDEFHHLTHVLRAGVGYELMAVDGAGTAYRCRIGSRGSGYARCSIDEKIERYNEPDVDVSLMLPILKNHNRIEWIVEKGTELGVNSFIPVETERTIAKQIRYERLRKIAFAAMKQSRRSVLPVIAEERRLRDLLTGVDSKFDRVFIGHENTPAAGSFSGVGGLSGKRTLLLVGPEGGFTGEEIRLSEQHGAEIVSLGSRRYRAETAALIMVVHIVHGSQI